MENDNPLSFDSLETLQNYLHEFAVKRDWLQFHSPKNLAMALSVEASELLELFQWLTEKESHQLNDDQLAKVKHEMADVLMYLLRMADVMDIDLLASCSSKCTLNETRFPISKVKGKKHF